MTDRYENIRKALARVCDPGAHPKRYTQERYTQALTKLRLACDPDTIRALLAERDGLLEACCLAARYLNPDQFPDAVKKIDAAIAAANGGGNG